jgi:hypothetical protein
MSDQIANALSITILGVLIAGLVYIMFWQPKDRVK